MIERSKQILQVAATYIGTVVGAGFASGQSIMQFFTVHGIWGTAGIILASWLFMWIGTRMMLLAHHIQAYSYQEFNLYLFGPLMGKLANMLTFVILFGVTAVMLSGTGSIFKEQLSLSYQLGVVLSIVLCFWVMTKEMNGILIVNALVVPLMMIFLGLVAIKVLPAANLWSVPQYGGADGQSWRWFIHPFVYTALNFAFIQAVMVPLGSEVKDERVLRWGGFWGGIGLGMMLLITHYAMTLHMPEIRQYDIPMGEVIADFGVIFHALFLLVVYGEIFTTLIGNVFGLTRQIQSAWRWPRNRIVVLILLGCLMISQIGFASLVTYLYPLFGYLGLILLAVLAVKKMP